jgi:GH15 family glucan-1,4-alpha-glucosidase
MRRLSVILVLLFGYPATAQQRTWNFLTTGNGYGFQIFDTNANKITQFLEHPYRYLRPNPADSHAEGVVRRNLAYDFYFGVRGGGTSGWLNAPTSAGDPGYLDESHIIRAPATLGAVTAESYFLAPFGYSGNALVALLKAPGASDGFAIFNFHMGNASNPDTPDASGESLRYVAASKAVVETGPGGGYMVYVPLSGVDFADCVNPYSKVVAGMDLSQNTSCSGNDIVPAFQKHLGADGWMAVAMQFVDSTNPADADAAAAALATWANNRTPDTILADARMEFESWRKPAPATVPLCGDNERRLWRQSEAVLRMGQIREANSGTRKNNGMILASLPPGSWHTGWVRDATYAVVALARSGHTAEAKLALDFFMNAGPVGAYSSYVNNQSYRISLTRYFGNGQEECDWNTSGPNTETDGWGLVLWAARNYVEASGDMTWLTANYATLSGQIAAPLEANLETSSLMRADSSIWEVHQPGKHYSFTTMAAARGLCDVAALAKKAGNSTDQSHYATLSAKINTALQSAFLDPQMALAGSIEGLSQQKYYDGSVAEAFDWNLLADFGGPIATATLSLFNHLRVDSGGFKRNNDGISSYDNNEWILVDLRISNALRRAGKPTDADGYLGQIVKNAAVNFFLLPELYNDTPADGMIGKYFGSIPMVGYGAGAYMITILDRAGQWEPNDCGDGNSKSGATFTCNGQGSGGDGGTGGGGSGGSGGGGSGNSDGGSGSDIPYRAACLCDVGGRARPSKGTMTLLALPWLFVAFRLCQKARCK